MAWYNNQSFRVEFNEILICYLTLLLTSFILRGFFLFYRTNQISLMVLTTIDVACLNVVHYMSLKYSTSKVYVLLGFIFSLIYVLVLNPSTWFSPLIQLFFIPKTVLFQPSIINLQLVIGHQVFSIIIQYILINLADYYFSLKGGLVSLNLTSGFYNAIMEAAGSFIVVGSCIFASKCPKYLRNMALLEVIFRFFTVPAINKLSTYDITAYFNPFSVVPILFCKSNDFLSISTNHILVPICVAYLCILIVYHSENEAISTSLDYSPFIDIFQFFFGYFKNRIIDDKNNVKECSAICVEKQVVKEITKYTKEKEINENIVLTAC